MKIIDKGIVFKGQEGTNQQSCAFPGICILPNGRWICTFRAALQKKPTKGQCKMLGVKWKSFRLVCLLLLF